MKLVVLAILLCFSVFDATAQKIKRADNGAVTLIAHGFTPSTSPLNLVKGDVAWTETVSPAYLVRTTDPRPARVRPNTAAIESGTVLLGLSIDSGMAFCPPIDFEAHTPRVQCLQDLDGDGTFDAAYVTKQYSMDTQFLSVWIHNLAGLNSKVGYEPVNNANDGPSGTIEVRFDGVRRSKPSFRLYVENERIDDRLYCQPLTETTCQIMGVTLTYSMLDKSTMEITSMALADTRVFSVRSEYHG